MLLKKKLLNAYGLWTQRENLFCSNAESWAMQLDTELRFITMGELFVSAYCTKIDYYGLVPKFGYIASQIRHSKPLPSFTDTQDFHEVEEHCLVEQDRRNNGSSMLSKTSSPTALVVGNSPNPSFNYGGRTHAGQVVMVVGRSLETLIKIVAANIKHPKFEPDGVSVSTN